MPSIKICGSISFLLDLLICTQSKPALCLRRIYRLVTDLLFAGGFILLGMKGCDASAHWLTRCQVTSHSGNKIKNNGIQCKGWNWDSQEVSNSDLHAVKIQLGRFLGMFMYNSAILSAVQLQLAFSFSLLAPVIMSAPLLQSWVWVYWTLFTCTLEGAFNCHQQLPGTDNYVRCNIIYYWRL